MLELWLRYRKYSLLLLVVVAAFSLLTFQRARPGEGLWLAEGVAAAPIDVVVDHLAAGYKTLWH